MGNLQSLVRSVLRQPLSTVQAAALLVADFILRHGNDQRRDHEHWLTAEAQVHEDHLLAIQAPLTALPNRRAIIPVLQEAIARDRVATLAFYLLDLDDFKKVDDASGHIEGDAVLQGVTQRFRSVARQEDLIARLGDDEFAVLARGIQRRDEALEIGQRYVAALRDTTRIGDRVRRVSVTVGVALYPDDGDTAEEIMHAADFALRRVKANQTSSLLFFEAMTHVPAV